MIELLISWPGLAAIVTVILAGAIQGSTGFGFNMLSAPLLAIIDPAFVPGAVVTVSTLVCVGGALTERRAIDWRDLRHALSGRLVAALLATFAIGLMTPRAFSLVFGIAVLLGVVLSLAGLRFACTPRNLFGAGLISGFMGTLTSIGAPPMAMVYQDADPARMRATLNAFFVVGGGISLVALWTGGHYGAHDVALAAVLLPFALVGLLLSGWGRRLVHRGRVKKIVLTVSAVSAAVLLWRALV
ncbi:sulfite exporter TauE/SafE family protein [Sinirhodobacter populi]|uniref:Probable membrane transporter protein n=1 Tax=Paenirhodobacter populi TaxID=2306993 RepID=A0A443K966_9RHOB|nr:sulfite exporter TauE/SafE family protein [Sinirhodobacter populi]RWR29285.1 sulfite exporter TauE/SafE family protein [Sinirhodobacter populi]